MDCIKIEEIDNITECDLSIASWKMYEIYIIMKRLKQFFNPISRLSQHGDTGARSPLVQAEISNPHQFQSHSCVEARVPNYLSSEQDDSQAIFAAALYCAREC